MLNPFAVEREILSKLTVLEEMIITLKRDVSIKIMKKVNVLNINISQDMRDKCELYINGETSDKQYLCKICGKRFNDGRKLGGHVSRAHKDDNDIEDIKLGQKPKKKCKIDPPKSLVFQQPIYQEDHLDSSIIFQDL